MIVAVHQPNYLPWLGFFHKIAAADIFIFLDDVQFSKGSYTNRVGIYGNKPRWLTVPISVSLGDAINHVQPTSREWRQSHLDTLEGVYRDSAYFDRIWPRLCEVYDALPSGDIASLNRSLIEIMAGELGLSCSFHASSEIPVGRRRGVKRLVALVQAVAPSSTYLSGRGGAAYQDQEVFTDAGIRLRYDDYAHPIYLQTGENFVPGLSVIDAALNVGWKRTAELLCR